MSGYKKMAVFTVVVNILLWGLLTAADYMKEKKNDDTTSELLTWALFVAMIVVIYLYFRNHSGSRALELTLQQVVLEKGVWLAVSAVFAFPIVHMVNYGNWIVKQGTGRMLNGFEYLVLAFAFALYSVLFSAIDLVCRWWNRKHNQ